MFRVTKYARSPEVKSECTTLQKPRQHYERVVVVQNSKNYISDVTLNFFFFRFSKSTEN